MDATSVQVSGTPLSTRRYGNVPFRSEADPPPPSTCLEIGESLWRVSNPGRIVFRATAGGHMPRVLNTR